MNPIDRVDMGFGGINYFDAELIVVDGVPSEIVISEFGFSICLDELSHESQTKLADQFDLAKGDYNPIAKAFSCSRCCHRG